MMLKNFVISYSKKGFTLAEVLITLVIVGVVAALTIPTLVNNTKKNEYVAGLKKANSVLSQAVYKIGMSKGYPVGDYSFFNDVDFAEEFSKTVNIAKKCNSFDECFLGPYKYLSGSNANIGTQKSVITSDGQMYNFVITSSDHVYGLSEEDANNVKWRIFADINGQKGPNQFGYDTFFFYLVDGKGIVPGGSYSSADCIKSSTGVTCAGKILRENAINY